MDVEEKIKDIIVNEIFKLFTKGRFSDAKDVLHKLYLDNYKDIKDLAVKRLLIHNLAWVEQKLGEFKNAKMHTKILKQEIESDTNFIENNKFEYCLMLNLYCEVFKDEINTDEYKDINMYIANYHHENNSFGRECIALANVYKADNRWDDIILLIKSLVSYDESDYFLTEILDELEINNIDAFNEAKKFLNSL